MVCPASSARLLPGRWRHSRSGGDARPGAPASSSGGPLCASATALAPWVRVRNQRQGVGWAVDKRRSSTGTYSSPAVESLRRARLRQQGGSIDRDPTATSACLMTAHDVYDRYSVPMPLRSICCEQPASRAS